MTLNKREYPLCFKHRVFAKGDVITGQSLANALDRDFVQYWTYERFLEFNETHPCRRKWKHRLPGFSPDVVEGFLATLKRRRS